MTVSLSLLSACINNYRCVRCMPVFTYLVFHEIPFLGFPKCNACRRGSFCFIRSLLRNLTSYVRSDVLYRLLLPSSVKTLKRLSSALPRYNMRSEPEVGCQQTIPGEIWNI